MAYKHGVYSSEVPTAIIPPTRINAGLPVVFGTAPIHLAQDPAPANKPILCYSYQEAVEQFGFSDNWKDYTLCEFIYSQFALFAMAPVVLINVLDSDVHKKTVAPTDLDTVNDVVTIEDAVILSTLAVKLTAAGQPLVLNADYTAAFNDKGLLVITPIDGGAIVTGTTKLNIGYDTLDPTLVVADDIIGGVDTITGDYEGLELINSIFPYFGLIPGQIAAPRWSSNPEVAAVMNAKGKNINSVFKAICWIDVPTDTVKKYTDVSNWKDENNISDTSQFCCWPKAALGDRQYYLSTQAIGVTCTVDAANDDIPYESPSNKNLQANAMVLEDGKEIALAVDSAAYLSGQGIVTGINFIGGQKLWGNRTAVYPANTDPKDSFIPLRRMFNWINNTLITTFWSKIDKPTNKVLIETILDSANIWLNGLTARGYLLGGRVEFRQDENPITDLMDGIIRFHVYIAPPVPAREIDFIQEYDPSYLQTLFNTGGDT